MMGWNNKKQETLVYLPREIAFKEAADAIRRAGGTVVWMAVDGGSSPEISDVDLVRVELGESMPGEVVGGVILGADHGLNPSRLQSRIEELNAAGNQVFAEVIDVAMGERCEAWGVQGLVTCGFEGGGFVGDESGLVLLRRLYEKTSLPVVVRGAMGPDSAAAVMAAGASGIVLEEQLWLCDEFPTSEDLANRLRNFNPTDTKCLGMTLGFRYRVFALIATKPPRKLAAREVEMLNAGSSAGDLYAEIKEAEPKKSWDFDLRGELRPLGQGAAIAAYMYEKYGNTEAVVRGIELHVQDVLEGLKNDFPMEEGKGIATINGTKWPIHQGPMAQVSDTPAFARAIADGGALPWLALGNMPTHVAEEIVDATACALDGRPYGAGIIGLDANYYRDGHIEMMKARRKNGPLLGLVAAGTAEQAMQFESANISSYLHTPTPGVLRAALMSGHRKCLLEGSEAGGHVGTLGGLALWQYGVMEIEDAIANGVDPNELCVVPAGGLSDAAGTAAVSALFFGLYRRGVHFGIQMGTAYLMTREAVETGALSATYQEVAVESEGTVIMGESVNTPTRVLKNRASERVLGSEKERLTTGVKLSERKHLYEKDNLGGLRVAAKGQKIEKIDPEKGAIFANLSRDVQLEDGLFHCGQGVAFCRQGYSIDELHAEVTVNAKRWVEDGAYRASFRAQPVKLQPVMSQSVSQATRKPGSAGISNSKKPDVIDGARAVAVIGIGACMPGALDAKAFWQNIVNGVSSIGPVPTDRWDPSLYFDADRNAPDKTYSKIGGWVEGFEFDRRAFRLPPKVVESIDPTQLICLQAVREALSDAGYLDTEFDRDGCAVILGNALGGDLRDTTNLRILYPEMDRALRGSLMELGPGNLSESEREALLKAVETRFKKNIVGINEDSMPGELANIIAGRVAQTFDLRGPNFITDAACASSLAALEAAVRGLRAGQFDMAVTGGADRSMGAPSYVKFSKIGALSADGSRPFDTDANGFVMGEGAGILILKRLSDAIRDGDSVYALIRGVGGSSDGRGKAITAPNPEGQVLAVRRAYEDAGFKPRTVSMIEAHGTSTPVGDPAEVQSLIQVMAEDDSEYASPRIALGSVKSNIGHLKSAAGAAGLIKTALALKHRMLPPTLNVKKVNPGLGLDESRIEVQTTLEPWEIREGSVRRAGVSAFGFGGTNFHVAMEEFLPQGSGSGKSMSFGGTSFGSSSQSSGGVVMRSGEGIIGVGGANEAELRERFEAFATVFENEGISGIDEWRLPLYGDSSEISAGVVRLAIAFGDMEELAAKIDKTRRALDGKMSWRVLSNQGVVFADEMMEGKTGMLFPGQGSQYLGMLSELTERFSVVAETFAEADRIMEAVLGRKLSSIIDPDLQKVDENEAFRALTQTEITQPAVLTADIAIYRLLETLGIDADMVAGHSLGEYGACVAAGVMTFEEALITVAARGTEMSRATPMNGDNGLMAGISAPVEVVQPVLDDIDGYVVCANINCPGQTIIAGLTESVQQAVKAFEAMGYQVPLLPVSHAFHTEVVAAASKPLRNHLGTVDVKTPKIPILTNVTGGLYPENINEIRDLLAEQVASPVQFIGLVERMYGEGVRTFVEVGPKRAQTSFVGSILEGREHLALYTNHPKKGGVMTLFEALATLWARGVWSADVPVRKEEKEVFVKSKKRSEVSVNRNEIVDVMLRVLCEKTGYDPEEIELDFELEADLGVDTVKQAEIMATVREEFSLERDEDFRLSEYPTLDRMTDYVVENLSGSVPTEAVESEEVAHVKVNAVAVKEVVKTASVDRSEIVEVMLRVLCEKTGYDPEEIELDFELEADLGVDTVKQAEIMATVREEFSLERDEDFRLSEYPTLDRMTDYVVETLGAAAPGETIPSEVVQSEEVQVEAKQEMAAKEVVKTASVDRSEIVDVMLRVLCEKTGYDPEEIELDFELEADLGVDTVKQAEIMATVREEFSLERDEEFRLSEYPTLARMTDYVMENLGSKDVPEPKPVDVESKAKQEEASENGYEITRHAIEADTVISGCSVGLPGTDEIFAEDTVEKLLAGTNFIGSLTKELRESMVKKHIVRLQKHDDGGGEMVEVTDPEEVIKLAGQGGNFDLSEWGISQRLIDALDRTSQLAFAAGFEALKDAGLPLIPRYRETTTGKKVTIGWTLPEEVGAETGVIFASAFAGQDALIEELKASQDDENYQFNHRFLLRVLGIANSRFAEFVGARGPNTKINNACASTTTAVALAQDWIRLGRCKRVIILSADDASGEALMEWVGSGFLATGAATTERDVKDAALPFDKRRHGMIIGMGALCLVVEAGGLPEARGIEPIADVLATHFVNSAYHPTRLDVEHIAGQVSLLMDDAEGRFEIEREEIADRTVFISHETYTPARGGSAAAEISALRSTFGEQANKVVIANTKGYTGHAMGAGIEDVLAMKVLQHRRVPAIANFRDPDPELGDLRLSQGGEYEVDYALRLAAGFGSQLALALFRYRARREDRVFNAGAYDSWLSRVSGFESFDLAVENRVLHLKQARPDDKPPGGGKSKERRVEVEIRESARPVDGESVPAYVQGRETSSTNAKREMANGSAEHLAARFPFRPVAVEAHTAAISDVLSLTERLNGKSVAIINGPMVLKDLMQRAAERCGARVINLGDSEDRGPLDSDTLTCDLFDEEAIASEFRRFGGVDGIINLLGFGSEKTTPREVYLGARRTFHVARVFAELLDTPTGMPGAENFFVTVTGQGGRLGFDRLNTPFPICGAVGGFTKSLAREWEESNVRVVDVARDGFYPELGLQILSETFEDSPSPEVGIIGGIRHLPVFLEVDDVIGRDDEKARGYAPTKDSVVLVTGGAKGITAEVALDLARRFQCKLALVGRSALTHSDPLSVDMDAAKERAKADIKARGERVTPVRVRDELWSLESQRTIAENMERMRQAGSEVEYFSCDVADEESVNGLFEEARRRFGKVTGIIHGAGVEESKFLADKTVKGFDRVFRGKALGGLNLWNAGAAELDFFVAFSSVAGRFGNAGQSDYSAANETLSRLVAQINATTDTRALCIDWTAWAEVGMAVEGSMRTILESRGVEFLPPEIGAPMVGDALESGLVGECLVAGELGEMAGDVNLDGGSVRLPNGAGSGLENTFALVDRVMEQTSEKVVVERVFDPEQDLFINDHIYEGKAILAGVMGYELMANAARILTGDDIIEVGSVGFERAIKLHHGEPVRVVATATLVSEEVGQKRVAVVVESLRTSKTGRALRKEHYRCELLCGTQQVEAPKPFVIDANKTGKKGPRRTEIYRRFFHTGLFQVLEDIPLISEDAVVGYGRISSAPLVSGGRTGGFITDPMVREMALQTVGLWGMVQKKRSYLPLGIGRSLQFGVAQPGAEVCIRCLRRDDASEHAIAFDVEIRDRDGALLHWLEKVELIGHRTLMEEESFPELPELNVQAVRLTEPEARLMLSDRGIDESELLTKEEQKAYARLRSTRRRGEWLAARVAARVLTSRYFRDIYGRSVKLSELSVTKSEAGAPSLIFVGEPSKFASLRMPALSLTHSAGIAIAVIAAVGQQAQVGIDLEKIEPRSSSFIADYFTSGERELGEVARDTGQDLDVFYTSLWTAKEAVAKALRVGLHLSTHEVEIVELVGDDPEHLIARVQLKDSALNALAAVGGEDGEGVVVELGINGGFAWATARIGLRAPVARLSPVAP